MTAPRRYVTAVLTVEVPDDDVWDQIIDRRLRDVVEELGLPLAPCDWTPDLDTVTDGLGAEYGTVTLLDLNPPHIRPVEDPMGTHRYTTDADVRADVTAALQAGEGIEDIDVDGVVTEIVATVGIDGYAALDPDEFWAIVARHDASQA